MIPSEVMGSQNVLNESYKNCLNKYLDELSNISPSSTQQSHQTTLSIFTNWWLQQNLDQTRIGPKPVCDFISHLITESQHSLSTINGYICTLSNYISYCWKKNPQYIKAKIAFHFQKSNPERYKSVGNEVFGLLGTIDSTNDIKSDVCRSLLADLRRRRFGTRNHVYAELIDDTHSQPRQVQKINISDLNINEKTVVVGIPNTHVVSKVDLVTEQVVDLPPKTVEAIEQYIEYERNEQTQNGCRPLLTTSHGRASASTLRRATKQASKKAIKRSISENVSDTGFELKQQFQSTKIGPNDLWKNSILNIVRGQ